MARTSVILVLTLILSIGIISVSSASVTTENNLNSLLKSYNVSSSIITAATYVNVSYQNKNYTIVYESATPYFLINTSSSQYSFVLNTTAISNIITNETIFMLEKQLNFNALSRGVSAYMETSASSLADCVIETGTDRGTCTVGNYCESCALVPSCNKVLYATNGPTGVFGEGIMSFQQAYYALESNLSILYQYANQSNLTKLNSSVLSLDAKKVSLAYDNVSNITQTLYENPIFPPLQNSNLGACQDVGTASFNLSTSGPWYCNSIGYCQFLSYNYTMLGNLNSLVSSINADLPTQQKIYSIAKNITSLQNEFITPILIKEKSSQFAEIINVTLSSYSSTVNDSTMLLTHVSNVTLSSDLAAIESNYTYLKSNYLSLNITQYSSKISSQLSALKIIYNKLNSEYSSLLQEAKNNTSLLLSAQLSDPSSSSLSTYAFQENKINAELNSKISNTNSVSTSLATINKNISYVTGPDISIQALSRGIDGPFVSLLSSAAGLSYPSTVSSVPLLSSLLSLIIGIVILLMFFLWYKSLKAKNKIRITHNTINSWHILFAIIIIIILIYVGITYAVASSANSSAPLSSFQSALSSSHSLAIVVNNTENQSFVQCAALINSTAKQDGYASKIYTISNNKCSDSLMNESDCMNSFARANVPVILLSYSNTSSISIYSMYGTALLVRGDNSFMNSCYASLFIR